MPDILSYLSKRELMRDIAMKFLGSPYRWSGDDPINGFDCSGLSIELLKSIGLVGRNEDLSAAGIFERFKACKVNEPYIGCFIFYGNDSGAIVHIEFCIDSELSIGASGGGSNTLTIQDAINQNAYIKIRPMKSRKNIIAYVDPFLRI